jgi:Type II/IV secretion system protein
VILKPVFALMASKKASDLFIAAGAPIHISVDGNVVPINQQMMAPDSIKKICYEIMSAEQIKFYEENLELNMSLVIPEVGNFRINIYRQRGSMALVARYVSFNIPSLKDLNLPPFLYDLITEKRGLILVVGPTGSGKSSTLAAMLNHRIATKTGHILTLEDPVEFMFRERAEKRAAPSAGLHADRRDSRSANDDNGDELRAFRASLLGDIACKQYLPRAQSHYPNVSDGKSQYAIARFVGEPQGGHRVTFNAGKGRKARTCVRIAGEYTTRRRFD